MTGSRAERGAGPSTRAPAGSAHEPAGGGDVLAGVGEPAGSAHELAGAEPPGGTSAAPADLAWAGPAVSAA